ncbi:hypothetical protein PYCCODRAFT_1265124 [Trametes coccinea BRFM310]|uniref:Uncharacterized protein n=1 Tax=Trametes coccinea (strain BRFM310) TaxID=1353009 RepID=A0A1Y2I815_TRAC3|nr:hypothetical protein PYCCODRAFT_1265124 [Trametes coccinea BRFM310]
MLLRPLRTCALLSWQQVRAEEHGHVSLRRLRYTWQTYLSTTLTRIRDHRGGRCCCWGLAGGCFEAGGCSSGFGSSVSCCVCSAFSL